MNITINVDQKGNGQIIWSPELNIYLQIYLLPQSVIDDQIATAQAQIASGQATLAALTAVVTAKANLVAAALLEQPLSSDQTIKP